MRKNYLNNSKRLVAIFAVTIGMQASFAATEDAIQGVDMTDAYLINPSFEIYDVEVGYLGGWDLDNFKNSGTATEGRTQVTKEKNNGVGYFDGTEALGKWVSHGGSIGSFVVSQTVEGLPSGKYQISVGAKAIQQEYINQHVEGTFLFANDSQILISTPILLNNSNYLADKEPYSELFIINVTLKEGDDLTFGIKGVNASANWICFDNFRIYLVESDNMLSTYISQIDNMLKPYASPDSDFAKFILGEYRTPLSSSGEFRARFDDMKSNRASTEDDYYKLSVEIRDFITLAETSRADMVTLYNLYYGKSEYLNMNIEAGIADLKDYYEDVLNALTGSTATLQEVKDLIAIYEETIKKYILSGADEATADNVMNFSFLIENSSIEKGTLSGDFYTVDAWQCANSGGIGGYLCFDSPNTGNVALEVCGETPSAISFNYYQEIEGLPEGLYIVKAKARAIQGKPNGNAVVYGVGQSEKYTSIYNKFLTDNGLDASAEDDIMNDVTLMPYVVEGVFLAEGGTLKIGVKNIGELSNQWTLVDDFEIWYAGNPDPAAGYLDGLKGRIEEANRLAEGEMLIADKEALLAAIVVAEKSLTATTSDEVKAATATLVEALDKAYAAITLLNEFINGVYKTVNEYSSDEDQIVQIMIAASGNVESIFSNSSTNKATLEDLNQKLTSLLNFATAFVDAKAEMEVENLYTREALIEFDYSLKDVIGIMADGDVYKVDGAISALNEALITLRNSALKVGSDYTQWIENPSFEDGLTGWVNDGMETQTNALFDEKTGNIYCGKKVSGGNNIPDVSIFQTVTVPNGIYEVSVDASATQHGVDNVDGVSLVIYDGLGGEANHDRVAISRQYIKAPVLVPNPDYDPEMYPDKPELIIIEPAELTYKAVVRSSTGFITFGIEAKNATCNYLRFDNFKLRYFDIILSIEDVNAGQETFFVVVEGRQIKVYGVEDYNVHSVNGQQVDPNAELASGIYIVNANGKSVKVAVK